jgi:DNA polymerase elongation subunit (family B)
LVFSGFKIISEEIKHANASYLPAVVAAVLNKRIPHHDELTLTQWYASRAERWRVLNHRLTQAVSCLLLFDALDIIGRAGEAARLSGVEFSQSFPGIRGSQYKVEGVLLRALQSLRSDERGSKRGKLQKNAPGTDVASGLGSVLSSSLTDETKSQTQSPWKMRRGIAGRESDSSLENRHYFFYSPSLQDTNKQEALEVQALTLEPQSGHYHDPVVVCDFTALYPSLVIAYNLCYSTCVGKLDYHSTRREMQLEGRTSGRVGPFLYAERRTATVLTHHLKSLSDVGVPKSKDGEPFSGDRAYIAPTGTMYVSEDVLKGVLPQVLDEILTTRAMLKRAAKEYKKHVKNLSPAILRQLEARQLALKYVANVTYGKYA